MRLIQVLLLIFLAKNSFSSPFDFLTTRFAPPQPRQSVPNPYEFAPAHRQAYWHFSQLQFAQGQQCLRAYAQQRPGPNAISIYIENYGDFLRLATTEDAALFAQWRGRESERLDQLAALPASSPYLRFAQAEVRLHWGFLKALFGEPLAGGWDVKKAYALLRDNQAEYPDFVPNRRSLGLLRAALGGVPERHQWALRLVGLAGDLPGGLRDLRQVAASDDWYAHEAQLMYWLALTFFGHQPTEAAEEGRGFFQKHAPADLRTAFAGAIVLLKAEQALAARQLLAQAPPAQGFALLGYLRGNAHLLTGDYAGARPHYQAFLIHYQGANYRKDVNYKLYLCHWLAGQAGGQEYLARCRREGQTNIEADRFALRFAQLPYHPPAAMLRARLLTDGGEYDSAWAALQTLPPATLTMPEHRQEYYYRAARIAHKKRLWPLALSLYQQTITLAPPERATYFTPNSALQSGYIYQKYQPNPTLARRWFKQALSYEGYVYEQSIRQKAKDALAELAQ
jgi:hypothetical protein